MTDVLLETFDLAAYTDFELTLESPDPTQRGYDFGGDFDADGRVIGMFDWTGTDDLALSLNGFDIDYADEVRVTLNGVELGYLARTANDALGLSEFTLSADQLLQGTNILEFEQTRAPTFKWGISDVLVGTPAPDTGPDLVLELGVIDTGEYGYDYGTSTATDGIVEASFTATGQDDLLLTLSGYDIDWNQEVDLRLNGEFIGYLNQSGNAATAGSEFLLPSDLIADGENILSFNQLQDLTWTWGVTDLLLDTSDVSDLSDIELAAGVIDTGEYGNKYNGVTDDDGLIRVGFQASGNDMRLSVDGYDIDWANEVAVLLNDQEIGYLDVTPNNGEGPSEFLFADEDLQPGYNVITFEQARNVTYKWGVTNILIEDALI